MFQMSGVTNAAQKGGGCFPAFQRDTVTSKTYYCFLSSKRIVRTQSFRHFIIYIRGVLPVTLLFFERTFNSMSKERCIISQSLRE